MLLRVLALREEAGRLDRYVDAEVAPRKLRRIALRRELDLVPAYANEVVPVLDRLVECPENGVVLQEVRHRPRVAEVVGGHDLEVAAPLELRAQEVAADAAEPVDTDPDLRHDVEFRGP